MRQRNRSFWVCHRARAFIKPEPTLNERKKRGFGVHSFRHFGSTKNDAPSPGRARRGWPETGARRHGRRDLFAACSSRCPYMRLRSVWAEFERSLILARTEEGESRHHNAVQKRPDPGAHGRRAESRHGPRGRVRAAREASRRPERGCPRTRQGRPVDLLSRQDLRCPSRNDLSVHQGIPILMTGFRSNQPQIPIPDRLS